MKKIVTVKGFAFVSHVDRSVNPECTFDLNKIFDSGYDFFFSNVSRTGHAKLQGYVYNLTPYLKKYIYKQHRQWHEVFAPNKTLLRKAVHGRIDSIVEL